MSLETFEVSHGAFASVKVTLQPGEKMQAESDAMVTRTSNVEVRSRMAGGVLGGIMRLLATGESLFLQDLVCTGDRPGNILLASHAPGDISLYTMGSRNQRDQQPDGTNQADISADHGPLMIRKGAFLAATPGVEVQSQAQMGNQFLLKGAFSGTGMFVLKASGQGTVFFASHGSIIRFELAAGEERVVDNNHVVAWSEGMAYKMAFQSKSLWHTAASGEGLGCFFKGPGVIFVQTHAPSHSGQEHQRLDPCISTCIFVGVVVIMVIVLVALAIMINTNEPLKVRKKFKREL